jgi:hypothetical protein
LMRSFWALQFGMVVLSAFVTFHEGSSSVPYS